MPTILELRQKHDGLIAAMETLAGREKLAGDDLAKFDALMTDAKDTKAAIARLEFVQSERATLETVEAAARPSIPAAPTPRADRSRGYLSMREYLTDVMAATVTGRVSKPLASLRPDRGFGKIVATAGSDEHATFDDSGLGFMIPETLLPGLLQTAAPADPFPDTLMVPMPTSTLKINARVDKNHSTTVSGGLTVSRRAETGTGTASKVEVEQVTLTAHPLIGLSYATEELLSDAPGAALALIEAGFRDQFVSKRVQEIISGSGVGEYLGIDNSGAKIDVAKETSQAAATITFQNVVKMFARLWGSGRWVANKTCLPQLAAMNGGTNGLIWQPSAREGEPGTLLGMPLQWTEYCAAVGTVGDIRLNNMSQYLEGTRQDLQTAESIHVRFLENERVFRFTMRTGGASWWRSALTPKNGDTLSPFIRLATRP